MNGAPWSPVDLAQIRELYPDTATHLIATRVGRPPESVYKIAAKLGLRKSAAYLASPDACRLRRGGNIGAAHRFKPGIVPHNKGLRRPGYFAGRMRETQFKRGLRSGAAAWNWRPLGTILPDASGYLRIKVREAVHGKEPSGFGNSDVWPALHRFLWEQHHGPIPPGYVVVFKDGDRGHCEIDNLEMITRAELSRRNCMWTKLPRELAEVIQLNGALKRQVRERSERKHSEKQDAGSAEPSLRDARSA